MTPIIQEAQGKKHLNLIKSPIQLETKIFHQGCVLSTGSSVKHVKQKLPPSSERINAAYQRPSEA